MKKLFLLCLCMTLSVLAWSKNHTVQRGETIESIAKSYGLTTSQLYEANPSAKDLFYVGLKLEIPEVVNKVTTDEKAPSTNTPAVNAPAVETSNVATEESKPEGSGWTASMSFSYGFLEQPEGTKGPSNTLSVDFAGNYWFMEKDKGVFASIGLGYAGSSQKMSISERRYSASSSAEFHLISIPIRAGLAICNKSKSFGLTPYLGFGLGISVKGSGKYKETGASETKVKFKSGKFAPDFRLGIMLRLWGFNVGGHYIFPLSDDAKGIYQKDGYPAISIGWGF